MRLPANNPAPTTRSSESDICATTREARNRAAPPESVLAERLVMAADKLGRVACKAGTSENITPQPSATASVKANSGRLSWEVSQEAVESLGRRRSKAPMLP